VIHYFVFFLIINIIVFVHECGHFLAARQVGIKVTIFSLGIGPEIFGFNDKRGTRWRFSLLPIGGYVMMLGDEDIASTAEDEKSLEACSEEERKQSFFAKSNWERIWVSFCGPFFNYIYAFAVIVLMSLSYGIPTHEPVVGKVLQSSPAEKAGIEPGDRVISVNGLKVRKYRDIVIAISNDESGKINLITERNGMRREISLVPEIKETPKIIGGTKRSKITGIYSGEPVLVKRSFLKSLQFAFGECVQATGEMFTVFGQLFSGKKSLDDFGGVVRMAEVSGNLSKVGNFALLIMFTVTLSLNLGFINLFPLPILDGGKILFSFAEEITGKKLNKTLQEYIMMICAILLILLMLATTVNDILRIEAVNKFVSGIMG
jgi:regulator of sigma E protease